MEPFHRWSLILLFTLGSFLIMLGMITQTPL